MKNTTRFNYDIMVVCFGMIFGILISPLLFKNQSMIPLKSNEVSYSPTNNNHYVPIPINIAKHPKIYTRDMNIYKIPTAPYLLMLVELILLFGIIAHHRALRKLPNPNTP